MKEFAYEAKSPVDAARIVAQRPGAKLVAGGTTLLDLMKLEIETPAHLVDVQDIGLDGIEATAEGGLRIGTLVTNTRLAAYPAVRRDYGVPARAIVACAAG
jgi:xanthine dehydrogenase YagS FAD-binding subunit